MHGFDFLLALNFESFCEVTLDDDTLPCLHSQPSHTSDKLLAIGPHLEKMHPEFLQLFKTVMPERLEAMLLKRLVAPPTDLSPLLAAPLLHAESTVLCISIQGTASGARGEGGEVKKFD